ncbi:MAG: hypothetical protein M1818_000528 [Claussenomyces sp. TS43310]|nr:MAG: hypothetical protein M1818_000528 [Claussenomyces sp. TS43310]
MAYNPGVSFFIPFHELDPSKRNQCIYFTQKGARCKWSCHESDNIQAIELRETIITISSEPVSVDLLQEYVLCNCCRSGRARHRDRIEDIGLLMPLALRWHDEIRRRAADQEHYTISTLPHESTFNYTTPTPSRLSHTATLFPPTTSPSYYHAQKSPSIHVASSSSYQYGSPRSSTALELAFEPFQTQVRYDLRSREAIVSTNSLSNRSMPISQASLSESRPHVANPLHSDSVSQKFLELLEDRDFEPGSLYMFDRDSSPGHVKIGWTASSVSRRLADWSKCGYSPNLLFSVHRVPHAQRAETLVHHELIKEWRRERMCKAVWCRKSHQEWFEISRERAAQVVGDWADFMNRAEPYDSNGSLKTRWREAIKMMDGDEEVVTAKKLLEHYEASLVEEAKLATKSADLGLVPKIEEDMDFGYGSKVGLLKASKDALMDSLPIVPPTLPKETPVLESEDLPEQIPEVRISFPKAKIEPTSDPLLKRKPLPTTGLLFGTGSLPKTDFLFTSRPPFESDPRQFLFTAEPPLKTGLSLKTKSPFGTEPLPKTQFPFTAEPLPKTEQPFNTETLLRTQFLFTAKPPLKIEPPSETGLLLKMVPPPQSELVHKEVMAPERIPVKKELPPEQIPLPSSPRLQSTTFPQDALSSQETASTSSLSTRSEGTSTIHIIPDSDANNLGADPSSSLSKTNSSISPLTINLPSATPKEDMPQTDTPTSTDTSTIINSLLLNSSDHASEPNPSDSLATSTSPRPIPEPVFDLQAPLETAISEALGGLEMLEREAPLAAEVVA